MEALPGAAFLNESCSIKFSLHTVETDGNTFELEMFMDYLTTPFVFELCRNDFRNYFF